MCVLD